MFFIRKEEKPVLGRERLTIWSGSFCSEYEGHALQMSDKRGYIIRTWTGQKLRVECETPRTEDNYQRVDQAINEALEKLTAKAN